MAIEDRRKASRRVDKREEDIRERWEWLGSDIEQAQQRGWSPCTAQLRMNGPERKEKEEVEASAEVCCCPAYKNELMWWDG